MGLTRSIARPITRSIARSLSVGDLGKGLPWDGVTRFMTGKGINAPVLGFDMYRPWINPTNAKAMWDAYVAYQPSGSTFFNRYAEWKACGFDHVRLCLDPQKWLETNGSEAAMAPWFTVMKYVVESILMADLKVIVDVHVNIVDPSLAFYDQKILAAYPENTLWKTFKAFQIGTAKLLNYYPSAWVAQEPWNETTTYLDSIYVPPMVDLVTDVRANVSPKIKLLIAPPGFANHTSMTVANTEFYPTRFDRGQHIGFTSHYGYYGPTFSHQSLPGNENENIHRLEFPANPSKKAAQVAAARAEAAGQGKSTAVQNQIEANINDYYTRYVTASLWDGTKLFNGIADNQYVYGSVPGPGQSVGGFYGSWMDKWGVLGSDMHPTEAGVHRDYPTGLGATTSDMAAHLKEHNFWQKAHGWNGMTLWCDETEDQGHFSIRKDINKGVGAYLPKGQIEPEVLGAIELVSPYPYDPVEALGASLLDYWRPEDATISSWTSVGTRATVFSQATGANQPALAGGVGGLSFTGPTKKMSSNLPVGAAANAEIVVAVVQLPSLPTGTYAYILWSTASAGADGRIIGFPDWSVSGTDVNYYIYDGSDVAIGSPGTIKAGSSYLLTFHGAAAGTTPKASINSEAESNLWTSVGFSGTGTQQLGGGAPILIRCLAVLAAGTSDLKLADFKAALKTKFSTP